MAVRPAAGEELSSRGGGRLAGLPRVAAVGDRAALLADIAGTAHRAVRYEEEDAEMARLAEQPLALLAFISARQMPKGERPDPAGPPAQIGSKIASALMKPERQTEPRAEAAGTAGRRKAHSRPSLTSCPPHPSQPVPGDIASPFEPSAEDIAAALGGKGLAPAGRDRPLGGRPPAGARQEFRWHRPLPWGLLFPAIAVSFWLLLSSIARR